MKNNQYERETANLLDDAASEIQHLRRDNQLKTARLDVFDQMMRLFHTVPHGSGCGGVSPDVVFELKKRATAIRKTAEKDEHAQKTGHVPGDE